MTDYEVGFLNKCAEYGLDADESFELLKLADHGLSVDDVWRERPRVRVHGGRTGAKIGGGVGGAAGTLAGIGIGGSLKGKLIGALLGLQIGGLGGAAAGGHIGHKRKANRRQEIADILGIAATRGMDMDDTLRLFDRYKPGRTLRDLKRTLPNDKRVIVDTKSTAPRILD